MKTASFTRRCLALCAVITLGASAFLQSANAGEAPRIDALHVAKIATDYLATHGRSAPHIVRHARIFGFIVFPFRNSEHRCSCLM